ncbi:MAG: hypothetical protein P8J45_03945 [Phycisphaerales bacterium]|jgi:hypothetical protein|nr:hypothetical protein [Phycisphaerales bacterium]
MEKTSLTDLLRSWPHKPGQINARTVECPDGRVVLQVRVELGILQMETNGRPDGARPEQRETVFELARSRIAEGSETARLDAATCVALRDEAALFSYRSVVFSVLDDHAGVLRDTERNLLVAEFVLVNAEQPEDRSLAASTLPQLLMMRARARSTIAARSGELKLARAALDEGLVEIEAAYMERGGRPAFEASQEARVLLGMREMLVPQLPSSQRQELRDRLKDALAVENFELAAILRNELRLMH